MNRRFDLNLLGWFAVLLGALLLVPLPVAVALGEAAWPFAASAASAAGVGGILVALTRTEERRMFPRDAFLVVACSWFLASLFGALPFVLHRSLGPVDALFETVSGFTTTGSTVVNDVTALPRSLLLWRAMTQWLGGMGIILFAIAVLPLLGIGGMQLFKAEVPGPVTDKVRPRLTATARVLWLVYVGFTVAECLALRWCGLGWFDAVCHSLTTLATGGFSTRNASVGEFGSPAVEWVIVVFMLAAGTNFVLHLRLLTGNPREVLRDQELRLFGGIVVAASAVTVVSLAASRGVNADVLRGAVFQVVSVVTTTGYVTADFEGWPHLAQLVLLLLMLVGGMSGSTGGGPKVLRLLLAVRALRSTLHRLIRPNAVVPVKVHGQVVGESVLAGVWAFLVAYALLVALGGAVMAACGYDLPTSVSAALTAVGNVGPGIGEVGAFDNFAHLPAVAKLVLAGCMLLGRLEIFTILVLFSRAFWRR